MIIYQIKNTVNEKRYIGQTTKDSVKDRWDEHRYPYKSTKSLIGKAIKKYGKENFIIEIIDRASDSRELNEKEIFWIKFLNTVKPNGYNVSLGGENSMSNPETRKKVSDSLKGKRVGWHHTEESKKKISEANKGSNSPNYKKTMHPNTRKAIDEFLKSDNNPNKKNPKFGNKNPFYGRHHSDETKKKLRDQRVGKSMAHKGRPFTEEHKKKLSEARKKYLESKKNIPTQLDLFKVVK